MPRAQHLARARRAAPKAKTENLAELTTEQLLDELEKTQRDIAAGREATERKRKLISILVYDRPRSEAPVETLMALTGYKRAMVYRTAQEVQDQGQSAGT